MRFKIEHEIRGRVRLHICQKRMTCRQADQLEYFLTNLEGVITAKVVERNQDAVISFWGSREEILKAVQGFSYEKAEAPESYLQNSGREMNGEYWEKWSTMWYSIMERKFSFLFRSVHSLPHLNL